MLNRLRRRPRHVEGAIRVLLVEDADLHIAMYTTAIEADEGLELVEAIKDPDLLEQKIDELKPTLVILDYNFRLSGAGKPNGVQLASRISQKYPEISIVLLTSTPNPFKIIYEFKQSTKRAKGRGFLVKSEDDQEHFTEYLKSVARGVDIVGPACAAEYNQVEKLFSLPKEDLYILKMLSEGLRYETVGRKLKELGVLGFELGEGAIMDHVRRMENALDIQEFSDDGDSIDRKAILLKLYEKAGSPT